jgi:hypothetical protein
VISPTPLRPPKSEHGRVRSVRAKLKESDAVELLGDYL